MSLYITESIFVISVIALKPNKFNASASFSDAKCVYLESTIHLLPSNFILPPFCILLSILIKYYLIIYTK